MPIGEILHPWDALLGDRLFNSFVGQLVQRVHSQTQRGDRVAIAISLWKVTARGKPRGRHGCPTCAFLITLQKAAVVVECSAASRSSRNLMLVAVTLGDYPAREDPCSSVGR